MLLNEKNAKAFCDKLLGHVTAADAEIVVTANNQSHLRFAANSLTTSGVREDLTVAVTVWMDKKKGTASTNETTDALLQAIVQEAEQIAKVSPVDREYLPTLGRQQYRPVDAYVDATANVSPAARAKAINDIIGACEKEKVVGAGFHLGDGSAVARATKNGNFVYFRRSTVSLSVTARTPEGDGSGYFSRNHFDVRKLDTSRVAREAIAKALGSRQPRPIDPGTYAVVVEPQAVADLLTFLGAAFDARTTEEGRSALSLPGGKTKLGERIFDERINVYTDPWHPELPGAPFAQGNLPAQRFHLVKGGVVEALIYSRFWADQKQKEPTPGPVNIIMESSAPPASIEEMIKDTGKGLLIGRFFYLRPTDPRTASITGLTRDGVWYIEAGKVQYPVRNLRFNQSILQMLAPGNVDLIGAPERVSSTEGGAPMLLPPLKVKEFRFTSQSDAI